MSVQLTDRVLHKLLASPLINTLPVVISVNNGICINSIFPYNARAFPNNKLSEPRISLKLGRDSLGT